MKLSAERVTRAMRGPLAGSPPCPSVPWHHEQLYSTKANRPFAASPEGCAGAGCDGAAPSEAYDAASVAINSILISDSWFLVPVSCLLSAPLRHHIDQSRLAALDHLY